MNLHIDPGDSGHIDTDILANLGGSASGVPFGKLDLDGADEVSRILIAPARPRVDRCDFIIVEQPFLDLPHQRVFFKDRKVVPRTDLYLGKVRLYRREKADAVAKLAIGTETR